METVELLSVASIGGGLQDWGVGLLFQAGLTVHRPSIFLCPTQVMKSEHSCPRL